MRYIKPYRKVYSSFVAVPADREVQNNLAYTPAQMFENAQRGIPISTNMLSDESVDLGTSDTGFDVPLEHQRFHDPAKLWQESVDLKKKFRGKIKQDKEART